MTARGETYVYPASLFRRGSVPPPTGRIPREIVEFFNAPGGHSLIVSGEVKGNFLEVTLGFDLPELEAAYDFVDDRIPARSLVLIDSIDALAEHYGIPAGRLITVLQKDLVEGSKQNVLYVLESSGETRLDYLGDGVVSLASTDHQGRRLRVLTIEKLRGQQIQQHRYLYTLDGGRLTAFDIREEVRPVKPQLWRPVKDLSKDAVSFGLEPLDRLTGGLYRGRVVAFEISNAVPSDYVDFQLRTSERPFLAFMAFDTLESVYEEKVLEEMSGVFSAVRRAKDVFVGFVTPQSASASKLENLARVVLHLDSINGSVVLYGKKPYTELFSVAWDWSVGVPKAELRPIV